MTLTSRCQNLNARIKCLGNHCTCPSIARINLSLQWKMVKIMSSCRVLFILAVTLAVPLPGCKSQGFKVKGTVKCLIEDKYRPLPYINVNLLVPQQVTHQLKSIPARTDEFGQFLFPLNFRSTRKGKSREKIWPRISVSYSYSGPYGSMEILVPKSAVQMSYNHTAIFRKRSKKMIVFSIRLDDDYCQTYLGMHRYGFEYYFHHVNDLPPYYVLYLEDNDMIHSGVPYTGTYTINIKGMWHKLDSTRIKHLFGHSIRQTLDGGFYHTLVDAAQFAYRQVSTCSTETSPGLAFNEGWAQYWSNECIDSNGTNYRVEGNVASALRRLASECETTKKQMVTVLQQNPGTIHSFCHFSRAHQALYNCSIQETCTAS